MISSSFKLTKQDIDNFSKSGFIKLKGLFAPEALECLDRILEYELERPKTAYSGDLSSFKYDMLSNEDFEIIHHPVFQSTLTKLSQCSLLYSQRLGFEIEKGTSPGFKWHVGILSFAYQRLQDFGCTIWIPLARIDNNAQGGGMSYISKEKFSGKFLYDYTSILSTYVQGLQAQGAAPSLEEMKRLESFLVTAPEIDPILNSQADTDDFELGDALLFDKEVLHRSCPLAEGPLGKRRAFVMRFIKADSTYDLDRVQKLKPFIDILDYGTICNFALNVCKEDGEAVIDSPLFDHTRDKRLIPYTSVKS